MIYEVSFGRCQALLAAALILASGPAMRGPRPHSAKG
jgi:hypothetical protein